MLLFIFAVLSHKRTKWTQADKAVQGAQTQAGLESSSPAWVSRTCHVWLYSLWGGAVRWEHFSRCRRAPYNRQAEHLSCQASLTQDHSLSSVLQPSRLQACCRGMRAQRDDTSEVAPALGAEKPGWGAQGTTLPCGHWGKDQGKKGGRGGQLTRELWLCPEK